MKSLSYAIGIFLLTILTACSNSDEPEYPVFMLPSSITTNDINGSNETFEYNVYGKIIAWTYQYNEDNSVIARYSYPDENTIKVEAEEIFYENRSYWEETIHLNKGRADKSEGTFILKKDDIIIIQKTYRLEFVYLPDNHLNIIKHSEVVGIGDNIADNAWDKSWNWENYLIWEDGNLKEYENYYGKSDVYQTTKYDYSIYATVYPVIVPNVIKCLHHNPLFMQGVFGLNSNNLLKSSTVFDKDGNLYLSSTYSYEFDDASRIERYTETLSDNTAFSRPISYKVNWTEK